jgi:hypothetical protein
MKLRSYCFSLIIIINIIMLGVNASNKTDYASIYMNLSKACVFIGKHKEGEKWLECAIAALESTKNYELRNSMQLNRNKKEGGGVVEEGKRTRSLDLFLRHRRGEIEGEVCIYIYIYI